MLTVAGPAKPATYLRAPTQCAAEVLRGMTRTDRRVVLCKGQISMADLVLAALDVTGRARVVVAAWEVDEADVDALGAAVADGRAASLDLISVASNRPAGRALLAKAHHVFGRERVHLTATHAKVATLEGNGWSLVIRGSLNMSRQRVIEQIEIEHSPEICAAWLAYLAAQQQRAKYPGPTAPALGRAALAQLPPGGRLFGLTAGFSAIDLLRAAVARVGNAPEVEIAGFKIGEEEARELAAMLEAGTVSAVRALVSPAFVAQCPEQAQAVEDALGAASVRLAWYHGRFFVVRSAAGALAVHSSANLNANPRCEQYDASEEPATVEHFARLHRETWERTPQGIHTPRPAIVAVLRGLLVDQNGTPPPELPPMVTTSFRPEATTAGTLARYAADPPLAF